MTKDKKYHLVYETTNNINGKKYIGVHSTDDLNDGYLGSGTLLLKSVKKHGRGNFSRRILREFDDSLGAYDYEKLLVNEEVVNSQEFYNITLGGNGQKKNDSFREEHPNFGWYKTPKGSFSTATEAAKANNISLGLFRRWCKELITEGYHFEYADKSRPDIVRRERKLCGFRSGNMHPKFRGWYQTPDGIFSALRDAEDVMDVSRSTISRRIKRGDEGYSFIPKDSPQASKLKCGTIKEKEI